jgi:hypothetical protein
VVEIGQVQNTRELDYSGSVRARTPTHPPPRINRTPTAPPRTPPAPSAPSPRPARPAPR